MRRLKPILISLGGFLILILVILAVVAAILNDDDYRRIFIAQVEHRLGCKVHIDGDFKVDLSASPSLTMSGVRLEPLPERPPPPVTHIGKLRIQISLAGLLRKLLIVQDLAAEDVSVVVIAGRDETTGGSQRPVLPEAAEISLPVFERIAIRNSTVRIESGELPPVRIDVALLKLDEVHDNGPVFILCDGALNGEPFAVEGQFGSIAGLLNHGRVPYPVDFVLKSSGIQFHTTGTFADSVEGEGIDVRVSGHVENLADSLKVLHMDTPPLGEVVLETEIKGAYTSPAVSNLRLTLSGEPDTRLDVSGAIGNLFNGEGTDLAVSGFCANPELLRLTLPGNLPVEADFKLKGTVKDEQGKFVYTGEDFYDSHDGNIHVSTAGRLFFGGRLSRPELIGMDLTIKAATHKTAVLRPFIFDALPELGPVEGSLRLTGTPRHFRLEEISARAANPEMLATSVTGDTDHQEQENESYNNTIELKIRVTAPRMGAAEPLLGKQYLDNWGPVAAECRLTRSGDLLALEDIRLEAGRSDTAHFLWDGRIGRIPLQGGRFISDVTGRATIDGENLASIGSLFDRSIPDLGSFRASFKTVDAGGRIGAKDVSITIGDSASLQLTAEGHIDTIADINGRNVDGIHLKTRLHASDSRLLADVLKTKILEKGNIDGGFLLTGNERTLSAGNAKIRFATPDGLDIEAVGGIERIDAYGETPVKGIDFTTRATAADTALIANILGWKLPQLGAFAMDARFTGRGDDIDLTMFAIRTGGDGKTTMQLQGKAQHIVGEKPAVVTAAFEMEPEPWISGLVEKINGDLDRLSGDFTFRLNEQSIAIESLQAGTITGDAFSLTAGGAIKNPGANYRLDADIVSRIDAAGILEKIFGESRYSGDPVDFQGRLTIIPDKIDYAGEIRVNKTRINTTAGYAAGKKRPRFSAKLQSSSIYLSDLGFFRENNQRPLVETAARNHPRAEERVFTDTALTFFENLKNVDASIELKADELVLKDFVTNKLDIAVLVEDGSLRIFPARVTYAEGAMELDVNIRNEGNEPKVSFKMTAEDVDVAKLVSSVRKPLVAEGILNLVADLKSEGRSARKLAGALNGDLAFSIEAGKILGSVDMFSTDAIDLLTTLPGVDTYSKMNCAAIRFVFQDGIGVSRAIYLDTNTVHSEGQGVVNLVDEKVDIVVRPESKRGSITGNSPVWISGSLSSPKIRKIPAREALQLAGDILLPYVFLPARGLGMLRYLITKDKNEKDPCFLLLQETAP